MESTDKLQIDITDLADIRAKLPLARRLHALKAAAADQMRQDAERLGRLVASLAQMVDEDAGVRVSSVASPPTVTMPNRNPPRKDAPAQDLAIGGLERFGRPAGPTAVFRFMEGEGLKVPNNPNALGAALWNAFQNGRIKKTPDGLYALLEWATDQPELQADMPSDEPSSESLPPGGGSENPGDRGGPNPANQLAVEKPQAEEMAPTQPGHL